MHLFIIDLFISIDTFAPIADYLVKKKKKIFFFNSNIIQNHNHKNNLLLKYLNKNEFFQLISNNSIYNLKFILISFLLILLKFLLNLLKKKGFKVWRSLWEQDFYLSEIYLNHTVKNLNIKSITILEDLPLKKKFFFKKIAKKNNIPFIIVPSGLSPLPGVTDISKENPDFFLSPNLFNKGKIKNLNSFKLVGSPRYDLSWISQLNKVYNINKNLKEFNVGIFTNPNEESLDEFNKIKKKLEEINIKFISNSKPREILPIEKTAQSIELSSTEIIEYSDLIIGYPSSILIEVIQKNKPIIFPYYSEKLIELKKGSFFDQNELFYFPKDFNDLIKMIVSFKENKKVFKYDSIKKNLFLKSTINFEQEENILENFSKFYSSLETY